MTEPTRRRLDPAEREEEILRAALRLSEGAGYKLLTREQIAAEAGCAPTLISKYFGEMPSVRERIMLAAIEYENLEVLLQGLISRDVIASNAPTHLVEQAYRKLALEHSLDA